MEEGRVWTEGVQECPFYMSDRGCIIRDYWYSTLVRVLTVPEIRRLTFLLPGHLSLDHFARETPITAKPAPHTPTARQVCIPIAK